MRIAFDLRRINNPGIGRYMKCLTEAVLAQAPENDYLLILPPGAENRVGEGLPSSRPVAAGRVEKLVTSLKYYSLREQVELPAILRRHKVDLLHSPHFNMPLLRTCPVVVTLHDAIYLACPQDLPSRLGRLYYKSMMTAATRRSSRIITDSEFSKTDLVRLLGADQRKLDVVYPGVDPVFQQACGDARLRAVRAKYGIQGDYLIYTGIYKLRKNHAGLLRAFRCFLQNGLRAQLVLAGPLSEGETGLKTLAQELGIANQVVFTGFVPDDDLPALYTGARVYACPSLYEGFGFTVLETMACGVPVVSSKASSLPEVAGEAAVYADALDPEAFGDALYRVFCDEPLRADLIEKGRVNLQRFSWEAAARQVLAVYQRVSGISRDARKVAA
jgi:glycosyltransferase involved in cell wall biosynthesis